jgi:hypothetical protein
MIGSSSTVAEQSIAWMLFAVGVIVFSLIESGHLGP